MKQIRLSEFRVLLPDVEDCEVTIRGQKVGEWRRSVLPASRITPAPDAVIEEAPTDFGTQGWEAGLPKHLRSKR